MDTTKKPNTLEHWLTKIDDANSVTQVLDVLDAYEAENPLEKHSDTKDMIAHSVMGKCLSTPSGNTVVLFKDEELGTYGAAIRRGSDD